MKLREIPGKQVKGKDTFYDGWGIMVPWYSRWAKKVDKYRGWYSAKIHGPNQVLVTYPAYPFDLYQSTDNFLKIGAGVTAFIQLGLDEAANDFDTHTDDGRLMRNLLLEFDVGTQLSVRVLDRDAEMGVSLKMELVPLSV